MKKHILLFFLIACTSAAHAQDASKVFASPTIIWYGFDFTKAKMIGLNDESPNKIITEYFKAWNDIAIDIDMAKVFQKNAAYKDPNGIIKANLAREVSTLRGTEEVEMTPEQIADMVKVVTLGQKKDGLAVILIVQSFNKTAETATVHVTFFDIATRKVLWLKKLTAKPGGGAAKNAWASALKDIINQIEKKEFKAWKKEADY